MQGLFLPIIGSGNEFKAEGMNECCSGDVSNFDSSGSSLSACTVDTVVHVTLR